MKIAVVTFPGSNCDYDCYKALRDVVGVEARFQWHGDRSLAGADAVILPGGFSYGDYLRAGAIARFSPIMENIVDFARDGGAVLGICNGFQILCESELLPGALLRNRGLTFLSHDVHLRVENPETPFTRDYTKGEVLRMPIAHGEGNYHADEETLSMLEGEGRIVFRYVDRAGRTTPEANPNGSAHHIAGIINEAGNVLGLMPHPERAVEAILGSTDGLGVFTSLVRHLEGAAVEA